MKIKNDALRMLLAMTALIITAMLANPIQNSVPNQIEKPKIVVEVPAANKQKIASGQLKTKKIASLSKDSRWESVRNRRKSMAVD